MGPNRTRSTPDAREALVLIVAVLSAIPAEVKSHQPEGSEGAALARSYD
jgi:hypothetical protein